MILRRLVTEESLRHLIQTQHSALMAQKAALDAQRDLISAQRNEIMRVELEHTKISRDLIDQFLITLDQPELQDMARDALVRALGEFKDHCARLEEQIA